VTGQLVALDGLVALIFSRLLLNKRMIRRSSSVPVDAGVDGRHKSLPAGPGSGLILEDLPVIPTGKPSLVVGAIIQVDVEAPARLLQPLMFQSVELSYGDAAHLRPRTVLEGVVVQELAAEQQRDRQHAPNLALGYRVGRVVLLQRVDPLREVVHSKKNSALGQSRGRQDLRDELAKGGCDGGRRQRHDHTSGHLGDKLGHLVDLVIEDGTDASGHDGGDGGGSDEDRGRTFVGVRRLL